MYSVGATIIYGNNGVCRIADIVERKIDGQCQLYYILKPVYSDYTITAPVSSNKVFMRPIISKQNAESLIDMIPSIHVEAFHCRVLRQLSEHYEELIKSHDCLDLIRLTMSIYAKKKYMEQEKRKFGAVDERFMKRAEDLLFGEFAVALEIAKEDVPGYIEARIGKLA